MRGPRVARQAVAALCATLLAVGAVAAAPVSAAPGAVVSIGDQSGLERDLVTGSVFMPVYLSHPAAEPVVVSFFTRDLTATAGADYLRWGTPSSPRTVTIPAGQLQGQINIAVLPDGEVEPDETFEVELASVAGGDAEIGRAIGTATIVDADAVSGVNPAITVSQPTVIEGDTGQRRAQFQIHLSRPTATPMTLGYTTADGSGVAGVDYVEKLPGTVVFAPGQISKTVDVLVESGTTGAGERSFTLEVTIIGGSPVEELDLVGTATIVVDHDDQGPPAAIVDVAAGSTHSCALFADGTARCWGSNLDGELGDGTTTASNVPVPVTGLTDAVAITVGNGHTCAVIADGTARCWGANLVGQLGNGTTGSGSSVPAPVTGLTDAVAISAGTAHVCAVLGDGAARCWGSNANGRLGDGTTTTSNVPVPVTGLTDVVTVSAGSHTCATLVDGTARCWGANGSGQLGNGTTTTSTDPVPVTGLTDATAISASGFHTCASRTDGTARCWGSNANGRLGNGTTTASNVPVPVTGLTDTVAISAGGSHTCAATADGTTRCWGANGSGQLGNGTTTTSTDPVPVTGLTGTVAISAGTAHVCAVLGDGTARCWGSNGSGRLGNGTNVGSSVPVLVLDGPDEEPPPGPGVAVGTLAGSTDGFVDGLGEAARFGFLGGIDIGQDGDVYVVDSGNFAVRRVAPDGTVTTVAGTGTRGSTNGPAATAQFYSPVAVAVADDGTVYVSEAVDELSAGLYGLSVINRIRRITPAGEVSTFVGGDAPGLADGFGTDARFYLPYSMDIGPDGNLYVAEHGNDRIRRVTPSGEVTTVSSEGGPAFFGIRQIGVAADGDIYFSDESRIRRLSNGAVATVAGSTTSGNVDGIGSQARFSFINGLSFGPGGDLYVADSGNRRIRLVGADGTVSTIAGSISGYLDGAGTAARFGSMSGVAIGSTGTGYVADSGNRRIRTLG